VRAHQTVKNPDKKINNSSECDSRKKKPSPLAVALYHAATRNAQTVIGDNDKISRTFFYLFFIILFYFFPLRPDPSVYRYKCNPRTSTRDCEIKRGKERGGKEAKERGQTVLPCQHQFPEMKKKEVAGKKKKEEEEDSSCL
jgi:hypothetical protein